MQCKQCGSEWKTNTHTANLVNCPFCGAKLEQEKENKLTFQNAKEALRYIVKTYGIEVIIDGLQLKAALNELIPDLKQERKLFMDAYEAGVCNALYLANDQPEIDKCIAILQSIKVLTQEIFIAEKWACYVVETYVYALNWNVPMFGITPNIHMYQIPENINESGESGGDNPLMIQSGEVWEDQGNSDDMWEKSANGKKGNFVLPSKKPSQLPEQTSAKVEKPAVHEQPAQEEVKPESPVFDFTEEAEPQQPAMQEVQPESPVFDFTEEAEPEQPAVPEEPKIESSVFDFTDEAEPEPEPEQPAQPEEPKPE